MNRKFVAYFRVSTQKQGQSGLGLEGQRNAVQAFLRPTDELVSQFSEIESGKRDHRPQLKAAIAFAEQHKATLLIAKLDRLSRNASFIFALRDSGVDFICADMPDANTLTVGIFAVMAQHERELISSRTKAALAAKKAQGHPLGTPANLTEEARRKGRAVRAENVLANENNLRAMQLIRLLYEKGMNYLAIATHLNTHGFRTATNKIFRAEQVKRLYQRIVQVQKAA